MRRIALVMLCALISALPVEGQTVGSKSFTESVILGEITAQHLDEQGGEATHRAQLGGSRVLWEALLRGDIDAYPEYSGTLRLELLAEQAPADAATVDSLLATLGLWRTASLGFNNTYALGMQAERAEALGIATVSDLAQHPELSFGFGNEFMEREDGWPGLRARYGLPQTAVRGLDHDLAYRGLAAGDLDVMDLYSTDAEIAYYGLRVLIDDRAYFPDYDAFILARLDLPDGAKAALRQLEGRIPEAEMVRLNAQVKLEREPEASVAAQWLNATFGTARTAEAPGLAQRLAQTTREHLVLVGWSLLAAILLAVPLGIWAAKRPKAGAIILGAVGVLYTIPSLALLVFMIPLLGVGGPPAMVALFLYSLLPIVRNTHAGLIAVPRALVDAATALGLPPSVRLRRIELPMASRSILAGVQTAAVINIGTATLGALIGAGGYGQPILTGIRLDDTALILEGALPAAGLALVAQMLFAGLGRWFVPKGLRLPQNE
ncbi:MAG: glycine betaine ABC transporter substrate-binding protein [Bacteroidota bacterium]